MIISTNTNLRSLIGSPGHHHYFLTDPHARGELLRAKDYILAHGLPAYVLREYPPHREKRIIINQIGERFYVVDGNKHLVAMLLVNPNLCVGDLECTRSGLFRFWNCGIEDERIQNVPYDVYIPMHIDTSAIRNVKIGYDFFKAVPPKTKIIPADTVFDGPEFSEIDKGRPLAEIVDDFRRVWLSERGDGIGCKILCKRISTKSRLSL